MAAKIIIICVTREMDGHLRHTATIENSKTFVWSVECCCNFPYHIAFIIVMGKCGWFLFLPWEMDCEWWPSAMYRVAARYSRSFSFWRVIVGIVIENKMFDGELRYTVYAWQNPQRCWDTNARSIQFGASKRIITMTDWCATTPSSVRTYFMYTLCLWWSEHLEIF